MKHFHLAPMLAAALAAAASVAACASGSDSPAGLTPTSPAAAVTASSAAAPAAARGLVVFDGCSLVADTGLDEAAMMPAQVMALLPPGLDGVNLGVPGQTTQMMQGDAADQVDPLAAGRSGPVLVVWEGTNDLMYGTDPPLDPATAYAHLASYCRARRRAGYLVVVLTVLPREGNAQFETARSQLNARLRAGWRGFADALVDVARDQAIGEAGDELDARYYRDTVHLTPAGYRIVAGHVAEAVSGLL